MAASVSYDAASQTATLTPTALLPLGSVCVATVTTAAQDTQGFTRALEDSLGDYVAMMWMPGGDMRVEGVRRLATVDLAVRGKRGERYGLTPAPTDPRSKT